MSQERDTSPILGIQLPSPREVAENRRPQIASQLDQSGEMDSKMSAAELGNIYQEAGAKGQLGVSARKTSGAPWWIPILIVAWYSSNIWVLISNRILLSNYGFKYPIFLTMAHMLSCASLSWIAINVIRIAPKQRITNSRQLSKIAVLSVVFCISIVLGNMSLRYIPVSFNQAIGATTPVFTAILAYVLQSKQETWLTYSTLIPIVLGIVVASRFEPSFQLYGFIAAVLATAARALKSVWQGILLSNEAERLDTVNLLQYMSPIALILLMVLTFFGEGNVFTALVEKSQLDPQFAFVLLFNALGAYFVNLLNFLVTKYTSPLTLQVSRSRWGVRGGFKTRVYVRKRTFVSSVMCKVLIMQVLGNAKGAVAYSVSIAIFHNKVSLAGVIGYTVTIAGVVCYSEIKRTQKVVNDKGVN